MAEYRNIKSWAEQDRPREKLIKNGVRALTDSELLALIIGSGTKEISAVELSRIILAESSNNFDKLAKKTVKELTKIKGVGEAKAISIVATLEIGRRRKEIEPEKTTTITSSYDAFQLFFSDLIDLPHEEFWVAFLNRSNKVIEKTKISQGGISGTVIDNRLIIKLAIELLASNLIICHNHPSGNPKASAQDREITEKLKQAAGLFDIKLLDHIIVTGNTYLSFADKNLI